MLYLLLDRKVDLTQYSHLCLAHYNYIKMRFKINEAVSANTIKIKVKL